MTAGLTFEDDREISVTLLLLDIQDLQRVKQRVHLISVKLVEHGPP